MSGESSGVERVLVTGAGGFLGQRVVAALLERGHEVLAMVRPASECALREHPRLRIVRADLRDTNSFKDALASADVLVHLAAAVTGGEDVQFQSGAVATERLLEGIGAGRLRRVVLASSLSVYDWDAVRGRLDGHSPMASSPGLYERDGYAIAKVWQERTAHRICQDKKVELVVLRPGFLIGAGHEDCSGIGQRVGPCYVVFGPLRKLPVCHVDNAAAGFAAAVTANLADVAVNLLDRDLPTAWSYARALCRFERSNGGRLRWTLPVPYFLARLIPWSAEWTSRLLFGKGGKLPSLLVCKRFRARFRPIRFDLLEGVRLVESVGGWSWRSFRTLNAPVPDRTDRSGIHTQEPGVVSSAGR